MTGLEDLPKKWRDRAMSVNDPSSPTLLVDCAADLDRALEVEAEVEDSAQQLLARKQYQLARVAVELRHLVTGKNRTCSCPERVLEVMKAAGPDGDPMSPGEREWAEAAAKHEHDKAMAMRENSTLRAEVAKLQEIAVRVKLGQLEVWPDASKTEIGRSLREARADNESLRAERDALRGADKRTERAMLNQEREYRETRERWNIRRNELQAQLTELREAAKAVRDRHELETLTTPEAVKFCDVLARLAT